jgi:hypothetical protein
MYVLDQSTVHAWSLVESYYYPSSFSSNCPYCGRLVGFTARQIEYDKIRKAVALTAECPACHGGVHVWLSTQKQMVARRAAMFC